MIIVADEMKNAVNYHTVQLILELGSVKMGILPYTVDTDEQISGKSISRTVVESDNVSIIVVLEIFKVNVQNIIVRTEDDRYITYHAYLAFNYSLKSLPTQSLALEYKSSVLFEEPYHRPKFLQIYNYYLLKLDIEIIIFNFERLSDN